MRGRIAFRLSPLVVLVTIFAYAAPASAQFAPANPFSTQPAPALPPAAPFSTPGLSPAWDPYATPGAVAPTPVPTTAAPYGAAPFGNSQTPALGYPYDDWATKSVKAIQNVSIRTTWINGHGGNGFGMTNADLSVAFAIPNFVNPNMAPLILTPGFNFHLLNGPYVPPPVHDLPGVVYDAFAQLSWQPQFTERLGADLAFSMGVYSDFQFVDHTSIRYLGRGVGTWTFSPQLKGALGVVYLDRLDKKILPVFGVIWTPNPDTRYELLFPQPKFAQRITNWSNNEIWGYLGGEYGGGQWSFEHAGGGGHDVVNYNDFRVYIGAEALGPGAKRIYFEVGYVFHRNLVYRNSNSTLFPDDTVMLRAGYSF